MPRLSLILSTYDRPRELACALASTIEASARVSGGIELLVADDGSGPETAAVVERFAAAAPFSVRHVHHPKDGFRLAAIRNRAIREARGEVMAFVDGDSLLDARVLALHGARCRPGRAHAGYRCQLDAGESERLLAAAGPIAGLLSSAACRDAWKRRRLRWKNAVYRCLALKERPKLIGGNCAVHRQDLERVNGFDERFVGWGLEDDDLARRLRRAGIRVADGALDCLVFHLFHLCHPSHRPSVHHTANFEYFHRGGFLARCRRGLRFRPLAELRCRIEGRLPEPLRGLPERLGEARSGEPPELMLVAGAAPRVRHARDAAPELAIELPVDAFLGRPDPLASCLEWLDREL
jgi:glycosyltransferase involved in cell wall biosynthesis